MERYAPSVNIKNTSLKNGWFVSIKRIILFLRIIKRPN